MMMIPGDHRRADVALAHPDLARSVTGSGDRLVAAHSRGLGGVLGQSVAAGVMQPAMPGGGPLVMPCGAHQRHDTAVLARGH